MRKVLIVDDAPVVLGMLKRALDPLSAEWEMVYVEGAGVALTALKQSSFDVLVTDMLMPGMDGLQLLKETKSRYPGMVRIGFSGEPSMGFGLRSAGLVHQFLEKPIEPTQLQSVITRSCALRDLMADEQLRCVVGNLRNLPSVPSIYRELTEEINSRDASLKKMAKIISRDLAMVAKMLQLVNSAFFGLRTTVSNPEQAVALLGSETIKSLVLSMQVFSQFEGALLPGVSLDALWRHGLAVSASSRLIAKAELTAQAVVDDSLTAGLLHDVGLLLLAIDKPEEYRCVLALQGEKGCSDWQAEQEVFGTTHAEIGAYLLGLWGVGEAVVEAVAFHHRPSSSAAGGFGPLTAVHVANVLHEESEGIGRQKAAIAPDMQYLDRVGMCEHLSQWRDLCRDS